jgi:hypothetical protein
MPEYERHVILVSVFVIEHGVVAGRVACGTMQQWGRKIINKKRKLALRP